MRDNKKKTRKSAIHKPRSSGKGSAGQGGDVDDLILVGYISCTKRDVFVLRINRRGFRDDTTRTDATWGILETLVIHHRNRYDLNPSKR